MGNGIATRSVAPGPSTATSTTPAVTQATAAGTFTLTVTDLANGCADPDTVTVTLSQPPPIANAGPDTIIRCDRPAAPLQGSASGGDGRLGYSASWSPTAGVANPSAFSITTTVPGTYTLTVTDLFTGCGSFDTVTASSDVRNPVADAGPGSTINCFSPTEPLSGSASGANGSQCYTYSWAPTTGVASPSSPQTTTILVEDAPKSRTAVKDASPHFPIFEEFKGASYLQR